MVMIMIIIVSTLTMDISRTNLTRITLHVVLKIVAIVGIVDTSMLTIKGIDIKLCRGKVALDAVRCLPLLFASDYRNC